MKTQPSKPSIAARELALDIADLLPHGFPDRRTFEEAQSLIQSALGDLLEKADIILCEVRDRNPNKISLMKALEPWKTTI